MKISQIFKSNFFTSISLLAFGSIIAQIVCFFLLPLITRIYSPEEFAVFTYILSVATIFMGIINCRYDLIIVKVRTNQEVFSLIKGTLMIGILCSFFISLVGGLFFVRKNGFQWYHSLYLLLFLLSYAVINVLSAYNNRQKEYKILSSVNVIRPISQNLGALFFGFLGLSSNGLLISYIVGQALGISKQNQSLKGKWNSIWKIPNSVVWSNLKEHKSQLYFSTPAQLINSLSYSSLTIFVEALFGLSVLGLYSLSVRLLGLPLSVISGNVSKVFYERAAREYETCGSYRQTLRKTFVFLLLLAIPMVLGMMTFIPNFCGYFLGGTWSTAGDYIFILAPMFGIRFIVSALSPALIIVNKQEKEFYLQMIFILFVALSFFLNHVFDGDINCFLTLISVFFSVAYILYFVEIVRYSLKKI